MKYHILYCTTNLISNKIYVGVHSTDNLEDGYLGSGTDLRIDIDKYGAENFKSEILDFYDSREEALRAERALVDENFVLDETTYNLNLGGNGSFYYINSNMSFQERQKISKLATTARLMKLRTDPEFRKSYLENMSKGLRLKWSTCGYRVNLGNDHFLGKKHSEETKAKMRDAKRLNPPAGSKNSQFGTCWAFSEELKVTRKFKSAEEIPEGWIRGRKNF